MKHLLLLLALLFSKTLQENFKTHILVMPTQIRQEAGGRQPLPPVASSSTGLPNRSGMNSKSQQAPRSKGTPRRVLRAGVRARRKVVGGYQSTSLAEGSSIPTQSRGCRRSDCMTCPDLKISGKNLFICYI